MMIEPSTQVYEWKFGQVVLATLTLALVAFGFWILYRLNQVFFILFIAIMLGTVIRPAVTWLYQHKLPRMAGVILIYLLFLAALTGFVLLVFPLIIEQGLTVYSALPEYYQSLHDWMTKSSNPLIALLPQFLPVVLPVSTPLPQTDQQLLDSTQLAFGYFVSTAKVMLAAAAVMLLAFHWALDGPRIIQSLLLLIPQGQREPISELVSAMELKVGFYIAGQGFLCVIIGVMAFIAYELIGLPNALVLALVAGVLEAVPMIGPLLGAVPAGLIALSIGPDKLVWVIVSTLIIQQLENALLVPRVMRKAVGVNPFVTLLALFAFGTLFGIVGALMAIPMAAIIQLLLDQFLFHPAAMDPEVSTGRDFASRLRYEAQDLAQDLRKQARLKKGGSLLRVKQIDLVMDEIEAITTDLDALLAQVPTADTA